MKLNLTIIACLILMGLATVFGLLGKPTEMGLIISAGVIVLIFLNIDKMQWFKGAGFEAKMKDVIKEANATIEQLQNVAVISAKATLTSLMADSFFDGLTFKNRLELHDKLISNLKDIGVSRYQIEQADEMWKRGVGVIYHRGIRNTLEGRKEPHQINIKAGEKVLKASKELSKLLKFEDWKAPSSKEIAKFLESNELMNQELKELIDDYEYFELTGIIRRKEVFVNL